jgi:threonine dehydrogenase-like Zn-dependent dehydrogenase
MGGWRFGNTIDGCQAEYVRVPDAMANLAPVPAELTDEQVLMCPDIMSTGFGGAESGRIRIGDTVAVFAQGPIGLCATVGARLRGASRIITVDSGAGADGDVAAARGRRGDRLPADGPVEAILEATGGAAWTWRSRRWARSRPSRAACACSARAGCSPASASTPGSWSCRWRPSRPGSATTRS